ncbi:MAG: amidohydrolase family protein [Bacteroidales bacterium]|nr:amidohydrolase family protein [Bacteroidales bacterium]
MLILKNGTFIDWQTLEFIQTDILVEPGSAGALRFSGNFHEIKDCRVIDCTGKFITKSFANGHHHAYSALSRGMPSPGKNPENFLEILKFVWWTLDKAIDADILQASALVTAMASAKNGVTFIIDHHASPHAIQGSLAIIARAFDQVGVGHLLCYEISDRDGLDIAKIGLSETDQYLSNHQGLVGLHASCTVGNSTLQSAMRLAKDNNSGIHIHVAEDISDEQHCVHHYHQRIIERLTNAGALQFSKTILAHCLHLDDHEKALVAASPAWVVQNMESNLNNAVGLFQSSGLGPHIMLGTDGMYSDMLRSAKAAFFAGKQADTLDYDGTYQRFRNIHHYLDENHFAGDGENNLVVFDYPTPTPFTHENFPGHFLFGLESKHVSHVISQGKLIVEKGNLLTVNEQDILRESRIQAKRLWERMK